MSRQGEEKGKWIKTNHTHSNVTSRFTYCFPLPLGKLKLCHTFMLPMVENKQTNICICALSFS